MWNSDPAVFIASALSPAHIVSVELNEEEQAATVIVPDKQLSLAIGKEGQNARLAAKLTGWRIDIKSASLAEAERLEEAKQTTRKAEPVKEEEELPVEAAVDEAVETTVEEPVEEETPEEEVTLESLEIPDILEGEEAPEEVEEEVEEEPEEEEILLPPPILFEQPVDDGRPQIRFAEDIMAPRRGKSSSKGSKSKKKKKGSYTKDTNEGAINIRRARVDYPDSEEDEDY
jgi:N utilization substance protein A